MNIIVYNHRLDNSQHLVRGIKVSSDQTILFQGSEEEFNSLGFSIDQVGGFELVNGILVFNQSLKNQADYNNKPILSGQELNRKLRSLFKNRTVAERKILLNPVLVELDILKEDDEVTQAEYDELKQALILGIGDNLTTEEISLIEAELDSFVSSYKL